jgi:hypothetical protein
LLIYLNSVLESYEFNDLFSQKYINQTKKIQIEKMKCGATLDDKNIELNENNLTCKIKSENNETTYCVDILNGNCSCINYLYSGQPCKHFYCCLLFAIKKCNIIEYSSDPFVLLKR